MREREGGVCGGCTRGFEVFMGSPEMTRKFSQPLDRFDLRR